MRAWRAPEERKTVKQRTDTLVHGKKRLRPIIMDELNRKGYHSDKFLKWIWPWDKTDKDEMSTEPNRINQRFTNRRTKHVDVAARYAIDAWFAGECRPEAIYPGIPELSGKYDTTQDNPWVTARSDEEPNGPPWFKYVKHGHRQNIEFVSKLPDAERTKVCHQLKRDFTPDGWKPVDIDALWKKFTDLRGHPSATEQQKWALVMKKVKQHTKSGAALHTERKLHMTETKERFMKDPSSFSTSVRRGIYEDALLHKTTHWRQLIGQLKSLYIEIPNEIVHETIPIDPFTQWILRNPEWAALATSSTVTKNDEILLRSLKDELEEARKEHLRTSPLARELRKEIKKREAFLAQIKKSTDSLKNQEYNNRAKKYIHPLYKSQFYKTALQNKLYPGISESEKQRLETAYKAAQTKFERNFIETKGYTPVLHRPRYSLSATESLEAAQAIRNRNENKIRQFARLVLTRTPRVNIPSRSPTPSASQRRSPTPSASQRRSPTPSASQRRSPTYENMPSIPEKSTRKRSPTPNVQENPTQRHGYGEIPSKIRDQSWLERMMRLDRMNRQ